MMRGQKVGGCRAGLVERDDIPGEERRRRS